MKERVRQRALELGFDACRFARAEPARHRQPFRDWLAAGRHGTMGYLERTAAVREDPRQFVGDARTVIALAVSYHAGADPILQCDPGGLARGVVARYARHEDYHDVLAPRLRQLACAVDGWGGAGTRTAWHVDAGPVLERDFAEAAGVGFVGKHTNLIGQELGNWFFLAGLVTTAEIEADPTARKHCGNCTRCLAACPTGAIVAPYELDARRCISYLTIELKGSIPEELRPAIGNRLFGCDDCLAVCPWNRFAKEARLLAAHRRPDLATPDLVGLLALDNAAFKRRFAGTPLMRGKRRGLLRNACVVLGNLCDPAAFPALERAASDPEPLIAEHARWAMGRIREVG